MSYTSKAKMETTTNTMANDAMTNVKTVTHESPVSRAALKERVDYYKKVEEDCKTRGIPMPTFKSRRKYVDYGDLDDEIQPNIDAMKVDIQKAAIRGKTRKLYALNGVSESGDLPFLEKVDAAARAAFPDLDIERDDNVFEIRWE